LRSGKRGFKTEICPIRPYNIGENGNINLDELLLIPRDKVPKNKTTSLQPGDVLFNNTNSVELVGKTALVSQPMEAGFSNHITLIRTKSDVQGAWLALTLRAWWRQGFFARLCNKWIGQAGINTETLKLIPIPLPPFPEQRRIVTYLDQIQARVTALKEAQESTEAELHRLEQAILNKAFRGEL